MPVYTGTYYAKGFTIKDRATEVVTDISGWEFEAQLKYNRDDDTAAVTLTTGNGGLVVTDGPAGRLELRLTGVQTAALTIGKMVFDVVRTDPAPEPLWLFGGSFKVKRPVTVV